MHEDACFQLAPPTTSSELSDCTQQTIEERSQGFADTLWDGAYWSRRLDRLVASRSGRLNGPEIWVMRF